MYRVEILDKDLNPITQVSNLAKLNNEGHILEYGKELSHYGAARFRVGTRDPLFKRYGNILEPYANHVRIYRKGVQVWAGFIISNPSRNKNYVEVKAYTYEFLLSKVLIVMDPEATVDTKDNYRTFKTGTMADAVTALINEAKTTVSTGPLANLLVGTIQNPNFPAGYTDALGANIGGTAWTFSDNFKLQFDFRDTLHVLQAFAAYGLCDFEIVAVGNTLTFNFKIHIGDDRSDLVFSYGDAGAIEDYNSPLDGEGMANYLKGISVDMASKILKTDASNSASVNKYGKIMAVAAYNDAYNINVLRSRLNEELIYAATPDAEVHIELNYRAHPIGLYNLGDVITIIINDYVISVNQARRIIAYKVKVHSTIKETVTLDTTIPEESHKPQKSAKLKELGYIGYFNAG